MNPPDGSRIVRLYYDRDGDLYPGSLLAVPVPNAAFENVLHEFKLPTHFEWHRERGTPSFWDAVLDSLRLPASDSTSRLWTAIQDSLNNRAVAAVESAVKPHGEPSRGLMVLVHGFNNKPGEAEKSYATVRNRLASSGYVRPERTGYLQLYWDGLTNSVGIPIWGAAQFNFPLVGLSFRRVLNRVPHDVPIRILTHSSGGPLISNTLWDASVPLEANVHTENWDRYKWYHAHTADTVGTWAPPSQRDLRVGMIVPAMPGETFGKFNRGPGGPRRIVIGANPNDIAIRKMGIPTSWYFWQLTCQQSGSTCLPARRNQYCRVVRPSVQGDPDTELALVDFSRHRSDRDGKSLYLLDKHGIAVYMGRQDMPRFLELLFADEPQERGDEHLWCS